MKGAYGFSPAALRTVNATPRYASGPATFLRLEQGGPCDIGIVGVPFDGGVTMRPGARHGPRAVREQTADHVRGLRFDGYSPLEAAVARDMGDIVCQRPFELVEAHKQIQQGFEQLECVPLAVGGDHSISLPILRALAKKHGTMGLIHIDAHADTGDDYLGSKFHHGAPFRRAVEEQLIDPLQTIQIGIRGTLADPRSWAFSYESGMRVVSMDDFEIFAHQDPSFDSLAQEIKCSLPTYVTFDIDALDPAFAPGTGTPEVGGLTPRQAQQLLRAIGRLKLNLVGADLVEVAPAWCSGYLTALNAANILHELLCVLAMSKS